MHVGLVVAGDIDSGSGGFYYDRRLCERLSARGHDVTVVSVPRGSYGRQLLAALSPRCLDICGRFDVVVEDGLAQPALLAVNRVLRVPIIAVVHMLRSQAASTAPLAVRAAERSFLRSCDAAIYNSAATKQAGARLVSPPHTAVIPPGRDRFDLPRPSRSSVRQRAGEGPLSVVFLGNVVERKGLDTLLKGLAALDADWRLTVVGDTTVDPAYTASTRKLARRLAIDDRVTYVGRLPDAEVAAHLRRGHVLAVPSRYEPFGMAYLEAMGYGCVPIATTNGGPAEFIRDGETGCLVPPESPAAITDRLVELADRETLAAVSTAALSAFEQHPTWEVTLDDAVDFLEAQCQTT